MQIGTEVSVPFPQGDAEHLEQVHEHSLSLGSPALLTSFRPLLSAAHPTHPRGTESISSFSLVCTLKADQPFYSQTNNARFAGLFDT